jgi:tRNA U34 5-methylaminomethyl-2-thiouridine-forming methyltransferase MnmC
MKAVETKDGTLTFYNDTFNEHYHSLSGAMEEAEKKYVEALGVKNGDTILDICFGLGYNSYAAIKAAKKLKIVALELDLIVLQQLQELELGEEYKIIKTVAKEHKYRDKDYDITLHLGKAQETIKQVTETFNIVFLDPFSPKKNPELWTEAFFQDIFHRMKPGAKLATYSCARKIRENLKTVGFEVKDGPTIGRWAPATIALKPNTP